jgi:hypothetical protein
MSSSKKKPAIMSSNPCVPDSTTPIQIELYTTKFEDYPSDLLEFAKENSLKLPGISTLKGQALALLSQPEVRGKQHVSRPHATQYFQALDMKTPDSIQPFNKGFGLKEIKVKGKICLAFPFEKDTVNIDKRKGVSISGDRDTCINAVKEWWRKNLVDVPNKDWQIGHLDPTIDDPSEKNLAYQPPIQGKYRDRFKFCSSFLKMWPTASELIPKFNKYYTDDEQRRIYEALKRKYN